MSATATNVLATARVHTKVTSPLGPLTLVREGGRLIGLYFEHHWTRPGLEVFGEPDDHGFDEAIAQLGEYFAGVRHTFDLPTLLIGTPEQVAVWRHLQRIPYARTTTYGTVGREVGLRLTAQEIGKIVGQNPLCIVVPCHRVIAASGQLAGYAGGPRRKRALLDLEQATAAENDQLTQPLLPFPQTASCMPGQRIRVTGPIVVPIQ